MPLFLWFLLDVLISGLALWAGGKLTGVRVSPGVTLFAAGAAALVSLIPTVGWVLSLFVLFYILWHFTGENIFPDLLLMVIVGRVVSLAVGFSLMGAAV